MAESRDNTLFATESLWSIREAGNFSSFTSNMHYLFSWLDYSFAKQGFDYIFNEWLPHLTQPLTVTLMTFLGLITAFGIAAAVFSKHKGNKRWAFIIFYFFSAALIWVDIFPTRPIIEWLYQFNIFLEAFRNPFTKLSILYSFVLMVFFAGFVELLVQHLRHKSELFFTGKKTAIFVLLSGFIIVTYISLPTFGGNFISEKLKIKYPDQYWEMFDYFQSRDKNLRMLQLPQFSHSAWVYHDWGFIEPGNGYQGMDFNFFGFPQAMMNRDSDRWVETSDFFYHQLKYALDKQDPKHFADLLNKYNIEIIWIDETKINAYNRDHDYERDHRLVDAAGFELVWSRDFLHVYEKEPQQISPIYIPEKISWINATDNGRLRQDFVYQDLGDYILTESEQAARIYPFLDLMAHQLEDIDFSSDQVEITREFTQGDYLLNLPGFKQVYYQTPAEIKFKAGKVSVVFPKNRLISNNNTIILPQLNDFRFDLAEEHKFKEIILFFNDQGVLLDQEKAAHPLLTLKIGRPIKISYAEKREGLEINPGKKLNPRQLQMHEALSLEPDWSEWRQETQVQLTDTNRLTWQMQFPILDINLIRNPSENCGWLKRGSISTQIIGNDIVYQADDYGVNCNGYHFDYASSSYPSVMRVVGSGKQGRGTKLFVSYSTREITGESYMLPESNFDLYLTLHPVTNDPRSQFILNWETRSFGGQSENILNTMQLAPLPLNYAAQLTLDKTLNSKNQNPQTVENLIKVEKGRSPFPSLYLVRYECLGEKCYLGLDQSYDDLWLGFVLEEWQLANHLRMNNWSNLWEVSGASHLIIFYLPELVSLTSLFLLSGGFTVLIFVYLKNRD